MSPWNRREFVAMGVGTVTAAITQDAQIAADHVVSLANFPMFLRDKKGD